MEPVLFQHRYKRKGDWVCGCARVLRWSVLSFCRDIHLLIKKEVPFLTANRKGKREKGREGETDS